MKGIDISHYQTKIDWSKVNQDFIICKCTEATSYVDPTYKTNKDQIRKKGIRFGAYHFARGGYVVEEAQHFLNNLGELKADDIIVLDWEIEHNDPAKWCNDFLNLVKERTGLIPYLYTNDARALKFASKVPYPTWVARYGQNDGTMSKEPDFKPWRIWQYTSRGKVDGISGYVDLNVMKDDVPVDKFLIHPVKEVSSDPVYITQYFGERPEVYKQFGMKGHNGIDYRTRFLDSPLGHRYIVASKDGKVIEVKNEGSTGYGLFIRLEHDLDGSGNEQTVYCHLKKSYVKVNDYVKEGQRIGLSDNTGFSSGPHLHFGYRPKGWLKIYDNGYKGYINQLPFIKE